MRLLGIDYGEKRIGLAWADELGLALPIPAAAETEPDQRWAHIAREIERRRPDALVVGYPYNMDDTVGFKAREVDAFIGELETRFRLPVHRVDERLSSYAAESLGPRPKRRHLIASRKTGELDSRAAALILQDFLDSSP